MRFFKSGVLFAAAVAAWLVIGVSAQMRAEIPGQSIKIFLYVPCLVLALLYLEWLLRRVLCPLDALREVEYQRVMDRMRGDYKSGFLTGVSGLGYVAAGLYVLSLLTDYHWLDEAPNPVYWAVFLLIIGAVGYERAVVTALAVELNETSRAAEGEEEDAAGEETPGNGGA